MQTLLFITMKIAIVYFHPTMRVVAGVFLGSVGGGVSRPVTPL